MDRSLTVRISSIEVSLHIIWRKNRKVLFLKRCWPATAENLQGTKYDTTAKTNPSRRDDVGNNNNKNQKRVERESAFFFDCVLFDSAAEQTIRLFFSPTNLLCFLGNVFYFLPVDWLCLPYCIQEER